MLRYGFFTLLILAGGASVRMVSAAEVLSPGEKLFETEVRPLLVERCYKCHGEKTQKGELRLDSLSGLLSGGESGQAIVPGKPDDSLLIDAIEHDGLEMPPDGKLKADQVAAVRRWIEMGAPWPGSEAAETGPARRTVRQIAADDRQWWSYQPVRSPQVPQVKDEAWPRNDIDRFLLARLESQGISPSSESGRRTLIRRLSYDLTGLPPTPDEVESFVTDDDPQAYEKLVERMLESRQYGERWARHWLDVVRYAESDGYKQDDYRPEAWRYRDYVIAAFADDKPYDQFVREQLAGDELSPHDPQALVATGYLTLGIYEYNQVDVRGQWDFMLNEITDVTADVFLAQGLACARCHDHKFDALLQRDYFRLRAYFEALSPRTGTVIASPEQQEEYHRRRADWEEKTKEIRTRLEELEAPARIAAEKPALKRFPADMQPILKKEPGDRTLQERQLFDLAYRQVKQATDGIDYSKKLKGEELAEWQELRARLKQLDGEKPTPLPKALTASDIDRVAPPTLIPGKKNAEPVEPGPPLVIDERPAEIPPPAENASTTGRRSALARWITDPRNPLTARVMVNRIWQHHFGVGLVPTTSDFGHLGESPSHPELLDFLATRFVESGWSVKGMHRLIVLSAAYRQASRIDPNSPGVQLDPQNRLLWRQNTRRLSAEQIRDGILSASGEIDLKTGGPAVDAAQPRRTIYTKVRRNQRDPLLEVFDAPENIASIPERLSTVTPLQSLLMLNSPWMMARSSAFVRRVEKDTSSLEEAISKAWRIAYGRPPADHELSAAVAFVNTQAETVGSGGKSQALQDLCQVLLDSNEFLYIE